MFRITSRLSALVALLLLSPAGWSESVLKEGDRLAICGDSITEQKVYSVYIEDYILMCQPVREVKPMQCGWGGTNAPHFAGHMKYDVLTLQPTVATTSYGMNDGGYDGSNAASDQSYRNGLQKIVENFKQGNTRIVIVGSPGVVDSFYFKNPHNANISAKDYNQTLGHLGDIAKEVAAAQGVRFADVHGAMMAAMAKAKAKLGENYPVTGEIDGVHAGPNGHLIMAYAYLKGMGCDGNIGTISFDAGSGKATATEGQRVISSNMHEIVLESSRYPFCFFCGTQDADKTSALSTTTGWKNGNAAILPFLPFNEELNRYVLVVKNFPAARAKITWGEQSKEFSAAELSKGVNLAAEFLKNPFAKPFLEVQRVIESKQAFETTFIKDFVSDKERSLMQTLPQEAPMLKSIEGGYRDVHRAFLDHCAQAVKPVTHTIKIEAAGAPA